MKIDLHKGEKEQEVEAAARQQQILFKRKKLNFEQ